MREPDTEGVATHGDPESCGGVREGAVEALTGARMGRVLSREIRSPRAPTLLREAEGNMHRTESREARCSPARSMTPCTYGTFLRENREIFGPPAAVAQQDASERRSAPSRR